MGGWFSQPDHNCSANDLSNEIDKQIKGGLGAIQTRSQSPPVGLVSAPNSGKSTIVKQLKIVDQGFSDQELDEYRVVIYENVFNSRAASPTYIKEAGLEYGEYSNRARADKVLEFHLATITTSESSALPYFPVEIADAIHQLWTDPTILNVIEDHFSSNPFYSIDSAAYFFREVLRIASPGYIPSTMDVLRARENSNLKKMDVCSVREARFTMGKSVSLYIYSIRSSGPGHCSDRTLTKWFHHFESITTAPMFCTALSEYDHVLRSSEEGDKTQNRMLESRILFKSIVTSGWFRDTPVILLFTKMDLFKEKLPRVPLTPYFPEYTGGADINRASKFILWKFMQANRTPRLKIYPHLTEATDPKNIRFLFAAMRDAMIRSTLRNMRAL